MNIWSFVLFWWAGTRKGGRGKKGRKWDRSRKQNRQKERNPDPVKAYPVNYKLARKDKMPLRQKAPQEIYRWFHYKEKKRKGNLVPHWGTLIRFL